MKRGLRWRNYWGMKLREGDLAYLKRSQNTPVQAAHAAEDERGMFDRPSDVHEYLPHRPISPGHYTLGEYPFGRNFIYNGVAYKKVKVHGILADGLRQQGYSITGDGSVACLHDATMRNAVLNLRSFKVWLEPSYLRVERFQW